MRKIFSRIRNIVWVFIILLLSSSRGHKDRKQSQNVNKPHETSVPSLSIIGTTSVLVKPENGPHKVGEPVHILASIQPPRYDFYILYTAKPKTSLEILGSEIQRMCISCGFPKVNLLISTENCSEGIALRLEEL